MEDQLDQSVPMVTVSRRLYTQDTFDRTYQLKCQAVPPLSKQVQQACTCSRRTPWKVASKYVPILNFIRTYNVKEYLLGDALSGLTASFMHFPQALGFGILASLRPEHGLYTTFFPVVLYLIFGTSPHISFGTNALMALLTQTVVDRQAGIFISNYHGDVGNTSHGNASTPSLPTDEEILAVKVRTAAACCLLAGIILSVMGLCRFGFLCTYMSDSFIGGFTTAAAVHITTSQVPKMFGIKVTPYSGAGKLILTYIDLFRKLGQTVPAEIIISVVSMAVLLLVKICINERFGAKMKVPVPIDLIVVVVGTFISHFAKFKVTLDVAVVGPIPSKFPAPSVPSLSNAGSFIYDAVVMTILSLVMSIAMAKLMSKKHGNQIDDNQEIFAYGIGNLVSGFFSCFPAATAPPRTMILSSLGAKTTLNGVPIIVFMLLIILVIGQLFVSLPLSVLAAMIVVSIKDLLLQYKTLPATWKINKYDFMIWIVTNSVGVLVDLNYGLFAGIGASVLLVVVQAQLARGYLLTRGQTEDVLVTSNRTSTADVPSDVRIFRFDAGLFFATTERFKTQLYNNILNPLSLKKQNLEKQKSKGFRSVHNKNTQSYTSKDCGSGAENVDLAQETKILQIAADNTGDAVVEIVIDCTAMSYIDIGGKNMLQQVVKDYKEIGVRIRLAGLPQQGKAVLEASGFFENFQRDMVFFETIDAIESIKQQREANLQSNT